MVGWLHWLYQTNFIQFRRSAPPRHTAIICRPQRAKPNLWTLPSQRSRETTTEAVRETVPRHVPWPRKSDSSKILRCKKKNIDSRFRVDEPKGSKGIGKNKTSTQPGIASWRSEGSNISVPNGPVMFSLSPTFKLLKPAPGGRRLCARILESWMILIAWVYLSQLKMWLMKPLAAMAHSSVYHQVWGGAHLLMLMIPPSRFTLW